MSIASPLSSGSSVRECVVLENVLTELNLL
jgi:hypothetical protein